MFFTGKSLLTSSVRVCVFALKRQQTKGSSRSISSSSLFCYWLTETPSHFFLSSFVFTPLTNKHAEEDPFFPWWIRFVPGLGRVGDCQHYPTLSENWEKGSASWEPRSFDKLLIQMLRCWRKRSSTVWLFVRFWRFHVQLHGGCPSSSAINRSLRQRKGAIGKGWVVVRVLSPQENMTTFRWPLGG